MFTCEGTRQSMPIPHSHDLAIEGRRCYGLAPVLYGSPSRPPFRFGSRSNPNGPLSEAQYNLVKRLNGNTEHARTLTYAQCSAYITSLYPDRRQDRMEDKKDGRLDMLVGFLDLVRDGYYATRKEEGAPITFMRLTRPTRGKLIGCTKVQTVHGSGYGASTRLDEACIYYPNTKRWQFKIGKQFVIDELLLLCADPFNAAMLYAQEIGKCCRCNAVLTDPRSRWNGIGPECEQHWPWILAMVAETKGVWSGQNS